MLSLFPRFGTFFDDMDMYHGGPTIHTRETHDGSLVLEVEVPRYTAADIKVAVRGDVLEVAGQLPAAAQNDRDQFLYGEPQMSQFKRAVRIPAWFDASKETHQVANGVLTIVVPPRPAPAPPVHLPIAKPVAPSRELTSTTTTDKHGLIVKTTGGSAAEFNAVSHLKWPPRVQVDDSDNQLKYTCTMPASVPAECIDLDFQGNNLRLSVHHTRQLSKQDQHGKTVFDESQSVQFSNLLRVPEGTKAEDISTAYNGGNLVITVSKHPNPTQAVPVTEKKQ